MGLGRFVRLFPSPGRAKGDRVGEAWLWTLVVERRVLSLSRKTDYALVALAHLATHSDTRSSARGIAEKYGLPQPALMNILNQLTHEGLVSATRGAKGGYRLARDADRITLAELIDAVEGPVRLALCCSESEAPMDPPECEIASACPVKVPIRRVHDMLRQFLHQVTLAQLVADARDNPVALGLPASPATPMTLATPPQRGVLPSGPTE